MRLASKSLNLTTSAVSYAIKRLEDDIEVKLFERKPNGIFLTYAGQRLISEAEDILQRLSKTRFLLQSWNDLSQRSIRIGASPSACQYIIPAVLREFKECFPDMTIQIMTGNSYRLMEEIDSGGVDVAIYPSARYKRHSNEQTIGEDELCFVVNPHHSWAQARKIVISEIALQRIILTESKSYTFDLINDYFRQFGVSFHPAIEISNEEVIKSMVELDIGIGILPYWLTRREQDQGTLCALPLGKKALRRNWVVAFPLEKKPSLAETVFAGISRNVAQNVFGGLSV